MQPTTAALKQHATARARQHHCCCVLICYCCSARCHQPALAAAGLQLLQPATASSRATAGGFKHVRKQLVQIETGRSAMLMYALHRMQHGFHGYRDVCPEPHAARQLQNTPSYVPNAAACWLTLLVLQAADVWCAPDARLHVQSWEDVRVLQHAGT
jgi:hypothetical protein